MSTSLILGFIWVLASAAVAMLPMRHQYIPGVTLLILAPVLIAYLGIEHGWLVVILAVMAFLSMFRNPLIYIVKRLRGERPEIPE